MGKLERFYQSAFEPDQRALSEAYSLLNSGKFETAIKELERLATKGSHVAPAYLGSAYENGPSGMKDNERALSWYAQSAERGNPTGQFLLGSLYRKVGRATLAREPLEKAAAQGFTPASYRLYLMYERGDGVDQDHTAARKYLHQAVNEGHVYAIRALALQMLRGKYGILGVLKAPFLIGRGFRVTMSALRERGSLKLY